MSDDADGVWRGTELGTLVGDDGARHGVTVSWVDVGDGHLADWRGGALVDAAVRDGEYTLVTDRGTRRRVLVHAAPFALDGTAWSRLRLWDAPDEVPP